MQVERNVMPKRANNPQNLIPIHDHDRAVELGRIGGRKTAEGREQRKAEKLARRSMQEDLKFLLNKAIESGEFVSPDDFEDLATLTDKNISAQQAILLAQVQKAISGDTQSAIYVRDTLGEKPVDKVETNMTIEDYVKNHKVKF